MRSREVLFGMSQINPSSYSLRLWVFREMLGTEPSTAPVNPGTLTELAVGTA